MGEIKWMQEGPFGIMVHYLKGVLPREGEPVNDWNKVVNNFNVKEFCNVAESTDAKWLIFPFGQNSSYYCSPNEVLEKLLPYHCTERDLMVEKPGPIVPPRFSNEELTAYLNACQQAGGAVTLNVGIYQDGIMAEDTILQLRKVSPELKK